MDQRGQTTGPTLKSLETSPADCNWILVWNPAAPVAAKFMRILPAVISRHSTLYCSVSEDGKGPGGTIADGCAWKDSTGGQNVASNNTSPRLCIRKLGIQKVSVSENRVQCQRPALREVAGSLQPRENQ